MGIRNRVRGISLPSFPEFEISWLRLLKVLVLGILASAVFASFIGIAFVLFGGLEPAMEDLISYVEKSGAYEKAYEVVRTYLYPYL